jgi:hypothetical protein
MKIYAEEIFCREFENELFVSGRSRAVYFGFAS